MLSRVLSHKFHLPEEGGVVIADLLPCYKIISPTETVSPLGIPSQWKVWGMFVIVRASIKPFIDIFSVQNNFLRNRKLPNQGHLNILFQGVYTYQMTRAEFSPSLKLLSPWRIETIFYILSGFHAT